MRRASTLFLAVVAGVMLATSFAMPSVAEAKGCADRMLTSVYSAQHKKSEIPKTRRVQRRRKVAPIAVAQPVAKPASTSVVQVHASEKPYDPSFIEELELLSVDYELLLDDPRRTAIPRVVYIKTFCGWVTLEESSLVLRDLVGAQPAFASLRARILPKLPDSDDASLV